MRCIKVMAKRKHDELEKLEFMNLVQCETTRREDDQIKSKIEGNLTVREERLKVVLGSDFGRKQIKLDRIYMQMPACMKTNCLENLNVFRLR